MSMGIVNKDTAATIPAAGNTGDKIGNMAELHTTAKSDIVDAVNEVKDEQANKADMDIVADAFNAAETYAEGDYCTYEGSLYKFKTAHEGAWDAADVDQIQITGELSELKNTLSIHMVSGTTPAQLATAFNKLTTLQKNTSKIYVLATDGSGGTLPCLYSKHYEIIYFDGNAISDIQLDISNSSATLIKAVHTFGTNTRTNTTLTISNWTLYYQGAPIS